jgi:hypothetical protein
MNARALGMFQGRNATAAPKLALARMVEEADVCANRIAMMAQDETVSPVIPLMPSMKLTAFTRTGARIKPIKAPGTP